VDANWLMIMIRINKIVQVKRKPRSLCSLFLSKSIQEGRGQVFLQNTLKRSQKWYGKVFIFVFECQPDIFLQLTQPGKMAFEFTSRLKRVCLETRLPEVAKTEANFYNLRFDDSSVISSF